MCTGNALSADIQQWMPFADAARHEARPFLDVSTSSGVYAVRVSKVGVPDLKRVQQTFVASTFMKTREHMDDASDALFAQLGLGAKRAKRLSQLYRRRIERIGRIDMKAGSLQCPII